MIEFALIAPWIVLCASSIFSLNQIMGFKLILDSIVKTELLSALANDSQLRSYYFLTSPEGSFVINQAEQKIQERIVNSLTAERPRFKKELLALPNTDFETGRAFLNFNPKTRSLQLKYQACIPKGFAGWAGLGPSSLQILGLMEAKSPWLEAGDRDCGGRFSGFSSQPSWKLKSQALIKIANSSVKDESGSISILTLSLVLGATLFTFGAVKAVLMSEARQKQLRTQIACHFLVATKIADKVTRFAAYQQMLQLKNFSCPLKGQSLALLNKELHNLTSQNPLLPNPNHFLEKDSCGFYGLLERGLSEVSGNTDSICNNTHIMFRLRRSQKTGGKRGQSAGWVAEVMQ